LQSSQSKGNHTTSSSGNLNAEASPSSASSQEYQFLQKSGLSSQQNTKSTKSTTQKILVYDAETDPESWAAKSSKILQGKTAYETVVIGVDPGAVFGVAAIADGAVIESDNCFNPEQVADRIKGILKAIELSSTAVTVKIGNGVPFTSKS